MCEHEKKCKGGWMHTCLVFAGKSQDFGQSEFFAQLHDHETVRFWNSVLGGFPSMGQLGSSNAS